MNKWLRKNNKIILAVAMSLLLVVWLGGSALTSFLQPDYSGVVVAKSDLGDIVEADKQRATFETDVLNQLGMPWRTPSLATGIYVRTEPVSITEWILLTREAERAGMIPTQSEVVSYLDRAVGRVYTMAVERRCKPEQIFEAVGKFRAVAMLASRSVGSVGVGEASIRSMARAELEKATVSVVALKADDFVDEDALISESDIQAQFEKHRETQPGNGVDFGYFRPARVRVQYFRIDLGMVADGVVMREQTLERKARDYWRQNREDNAFRRLPEDIEIERAVREDLIKSGDWDGDVDDPIATHHESFDQARDEAVRIIQDQEARKQIQKVADWLTGELAVPWYDREDGEDGYKLAPDGVMPRSYYQTVLDRLPKQLQYGGAVSIAETDWFAGDEAVTLPDIGSARVANPALSGAGFRDLAFLVQGITSMPTDARANNTSVYLALGQSCVFPLTDRQGNYYVYRVTEVKPPGPAEALADVRDRVAEDARLQKAFDACREEADRLLAGAEDSLEEAFSGNERVQAIVAKPGKPASFGQKTGFYESRPFGRILQLSAGTERAGFKQFVNGIGQVDREFIDACFALQDKPAGAQRMIRELPSLGVVAVVEWSGLTPMYKPDFERERARIVNAARSTLTSTMMTEWFSPQRIRGRHGFEFVESQ